MSTHGKHTHQRHDPAVGKLGLDFRIAGTENYIAIKCVALDTFICVSSVMTC